MTAFVARRLWQGLAVILAVTVLAFLISRFLGDPVVTILGASSTGSQREALRHQLGFDRPLLVQFASYLTRVLHGDFGVSYRLGRPVATVLVERAPATIELAVVGMGLALLIGIPAGIYAALDRRIGGKLLLGLSLLGMSMPSFFMGILLIWIFSVTFGWLTPSGRGDVVSIGLWTTGLLTRSGVESIIMPALTISFFQIAMIMRLVRAEMLQVLRTEHIRFARARGLPNRSIHLHHALRNTLIPVVTVAGLQLGSVIGFAVVTEYVFQWPGLGLLFLESVTAADVPVLGAYLLLIAIIFVGINLAVDVFYYALDPRLRRARSASAVA